MSKQTTANLTRQILSLSAKDRATLRDVSDDGELLRLLKELGIAIPTSTWWLKVIKVLIYALGIFLAGVGTTATASAMNVIF